jgi:hypothetical protein
VARLVGEPRLREMVATAEAEGLGDEARELIALAGAGP